MARRALRRALIDVEFAHCKSDRRTRGHRFLSPAFFEVGSAEAYVEQLRAAHVLVDREERERTMMERVTAAAKALGGVHDPEPALVDENASLVEEPHVVTGSFEPAFLELPARGHPRGRARSPEVLRVQKSPPSPTRSSRTTSPS